MWEYRVEIEGSFVNPDFEGWLNEIGRGGWELVQIDTVEFVNYDVKQKKFIFKRRVDCEKPRFIINLPGDASEQTLDTVKKYMPNEAWR